MRRLILIFFSLLLVLCSYPAFGQLASQQPQIASVTGTCTENWDCTAWGSCSEGISTRSCYDLNSCGTANEVPAETALCSNVLPYCYDGIINQDESDVDCGGKICDACELGKSCFRDDDCAFGICINNVCAYEQVTTPAPVIFISSLSLSTVLLWATAIILVIAIIIVLIALMKKLKRRKILIISDKKEVKEEIKKIISVNKMTKKSKASKFFDNFNGYLKSIKSESRTVKPANIQKEEKKDLLNENSSNIRAHPAKDFMLSNLKEVYKNG
jgi:uncharacterized protein (DUF983 family)